MFDNHPFGLKIVILLIDLVIVCWILLVVHYNVEIKLIINHYLLQEIKKLFIVIVFESSHFIFSEKVVIRYYYDEDKMVVDMNVVIDVKVTSKGSI